MPGVEDIPDQTKFFNKATGQEINPVLFDDKAGTRYVLTESGVQKDVDLGKRIGTQLRSLGYVDPESKGGAWTTKSGKSSGPGFGVEGMYSQIGQRLAQDAGITDVKDLGVRTTDGVDEDGNAIKTNEFYNKRTGQAISSTLGGWGEGPGITYANLQVGADGKPIISTYGEDTTSGIVKFADLAASLLASVPGPWQAPAQVYVAARGAMEGDIRGVAKLILPAPLSAAVDLVYNLCLRLLRSNCCQLNN